nr:radical SAM protein [Syntrophales bacterium]
MELQDHSLNPGLYIHIPFCKAKCPYCSFYSITDLNLKKRFLFALNAEMPFYRASFPLFDSLYIGGGTPSVLNPAEFERLFRSIRDHFSFTHDTEITVEINPADQDANMLFFLRNLGVNRLNIGVQSFDDTILTFLGRRHSAWEAKETLALASRAGFAHLGLDLIYGV